MQKSWWVRLWDSWKVVAKLVGYVAVESLPILLFAVLSILLWTFALAPAIRWCLDRSPFSTQEQEYLAFAIGQLSDWTWRIILLGAFAAVVYEQLKRQEAQDSKIRGYKKQYPTILRERQWTRLDELLASYSNFKRDNPDAADYKFEQDLGAGYYKRVIEYHSDKNWADAYKWMDEVFKHLDVRHTTLKLIYTFPTNLIAADQENNQAVECIKQLEDRLRPSFLVHHQDILRKTIDKNPSVKELIKYYLTEIPDGEWRMNRDYILYPILGEWQSRDKVFKDWLERQNLRPERVEAAFQGFAEDEPNELFAPEFRIALSDSTGTEHAHTIAHGDEGVGKTHLMKQILYQSATNRSHVLAFKWSRALDLMSSGAMTPSAIVWSLLDDLCPALKERDWNPLVSYLETELGKPRTEGTWEPVLQRLKRDLRALHIDAVLVCLDRSDELSEVRRELHRLAAILTGFFRPQVYQDIQPWYLKLFLTTFSYSQLPTVFPQNNYFREPLIFPWNNTSLEQLVDNRFKYCPVLGIPPRLDAISKPEFRERLFSMSNTPRAALAQLNLAMHRRAIKWDLARDPDQAVLDWQDLVG